jgi:hypothetical protein
MRVLRTTFFRGGKAVLFPVARPEPGSRCDGEDGQVFSVRRSHKIAFYDGSFAEHCQVLRLFQNDTTIDFFYNLCLQLTGDRPQFFWAKLATIVLD